MVVLVRPQLGENIGTAARAMLNFGLTRMRLVSPRDGWPNPDAGPAASGADLVLANAEVFSSVADAVADCRHVYATTVRKRGLIKRVVTPAEAAEETVERSVRTAILFGAEATGLANDEVGHAQEILTVPVNPDFSSLNLAQAVILCAYEWSRHAGLPRGEELDLPAPQEEVDGLVHQLDAALETSGYFRVESRIASARRTLRSLFTRPGYTSQEIRTLRGIVSSLTRST
ncbi:MULTISPECIES: RNA methyltransferase [Pacificimonas]|uniref:RNA methyltransferase n=1 Tax=Pacificimonas TaxID=1960290 RepID=UPI001FB059A0|nr:MULTISPECIES: RNA methyltransferase [Pacificimonas]